MLSEKKRAVLGPGRKPYISTLTPKRDHTYAVELKRSKASTSGQAWYPETPKSLELRNIP